MFRQIEAYTEMALFAMNRICPLWNPSPKRCVWSRFSAAHHCGHFCCFFALHFSAQTSVAYNKTVLWKHLGVLTDNDEFKYQHRDMTKRASKAACHCSHKPYERMEAKLELPTLFPWPGWQRSIHLDKIEGIAKIIEPSMGADLS